MIYKNKKHTFVIYKGIVTLPEWVFRRSRQVSDLVAGMNAALVAPAVTLTPAQIPADQPAVRLVLSDGTEHALANATINGSTVELAAL